MFANWPANQYFAVLLRFALVALASITRGAVAQRVIHVDSGAVGRNNGMTWTDAFVNLRDALDDAKNNGGCPCEIWVAAGTYHPDRGTGDPTRAFELANSIEIYGGYAGGEERRNERDRVANETILSGDLLEDDDFDAQSTSGCCRSFEVCDDSACRDLVIAFDPVLANCGTIWGSICASAAVSLCCDLCRPTRCDNSFNVVRAIDTDSSPLIDGLTIERGEAISFSIIDTFQAGGGLYCSRSEARVVDCTFRRNNAISGAALATYSGRPAVDNCLFIENGFGPNHPFAVDATAGSNHAIRISNSTFAANQGGGAMTILGGDDPIVGCNFVRNNGHSLLNSGNRDIVDCTFIDNTGGHGVWSTSSARFIDCRFLGNTTPFTGAAIYMQSGEAAVINSLFSGNTAGTESDPGGVGAFHGSGFGVDRFTNCTIVNNYGGGVGGISTSSLILRNCLLWGNRNDYGYTELAQVAGSPGLIQASYSMIQSWTGTLGGVGNSGLDPLFVDPDGADDLPGTEDDDLRLSPGSPAINAGDPNVTGLPPLDLDGHSRELCGRVDMGAYELGIGDYDCDGVVGFLDVGAFPDCMFGPLGPGNLSESRNSSPLRIAGPSSIQSLGTSGSCASFDFDGDGDFDLADFAAFTRALPGP